MICPARTGRTTHLLWSMCPARTGRMTDLLWSMSVKSVLTVVKRLDWMVTETVDLRRILNPGNQLPGEPWSVGRHRCSGTSHRRPRVSHLIGRQQSGGFGLAGLEASRPCMTKPYGAVTSECRGWRRDSLLRPGYSEERGRPGAPSPASGQPPRGWRWREPRSAPSECIRQRQSR